MHGPARLRQHAPPDRFELSTVHGRDQRATAASEGDSQGVPVSGAARGVHIQAKGVVAGAVEQRGAEAHGFEALIERIGGQ